MYVCLCLESFITLLIYNQMLYPFDCNFYLMTSILPLTNHYLESSNRTQYDLFFPQIKPFSPNKTFFPIWNCFANSQINLVLHLSILVLTIRNFSSFISIFRLNTFSNLFQVNNHINNHILFE